MTDNTVKKIKEILKKNNNGSSTITELVNISKLTRSAVRTALAELKGAKEVSIRKIGMAKVYFLKNQRFFETSTELKFLKQNKKRKKK